MISDAKCWKKYQHRTHCLLQLTPFSKIFCRRLRWNFNKNTSLKGASILQVTKMVDLNKCHEDWNITDFTDDELMT